MTRLARLVLAVKRAQRIGVDATLTLIAKLVGMLGLVITYRLRVSGTTRFITHRVDEQCHLLGGDTERGKETHAHDDHLGIGNWLGSAKALDTHLPEFAIAALLRTLGAKHRPRVPELCRSRALRYEGVLGDGTHNACRALGTQREDLVTLERGALAHCLHGPHRPYREELLAGNVTRLSNATREELGALENRRLDGLVAIGGKHLVRTCNELKPRTCAVKDKILSTFRRLVSHYLPSFSFVWSPLVPGSSLTTMASTSMGCGSSEFCTSSTVALMVVSSSSYACL